MRYSALRRVTSNASMLLLGNMLRMLFTIVFVVYAARVLGVAGFGTYALAQNLVELALSLSATGLGILVTRETAKDARWLERHLAPALVLVMGLSVVAGGVLVLLASLAGYSAETRLAVLIGVFSLLPAAMSVLAEAVLVAQDKAKYVGLGIAAESFVRVAVGFAVLVLGFGLTGLFVVLIASRVAQLLFYASLLAPRLTEVKWRATLRSFSDLVRQWRVFALENWLSTLYLSLDVVFLSLFHGEAAVGIYEAAHKLIRFGAVAARCFTTAVFPYIARLHMDANDAFDRVNVQSTRYILAAVLPVAIVITLLAPQIVMVVFDQHYADSVPVLQVLAWVLIPQFLNPFLSHVLFARGDQRQSLIVAAVALAAFLTVAVLLIPTWGAVGTAWASLLATMTALGGYLLFVAAGSIGRAGAAMLLRLAIAGGVLGGLVMLMRDYGTVLPLIAGGAAYFVALVLLRVVRASDLKLLQELR
jgi:O-antigen/teichoic acid export membrane protein